MFELRILPPALRFLEALEGADLQEVRRLLDIIAIDPFWDQRHKFPFPAFPGVVSIYRTAQFKIVYHLLNNTQVNIWAIGRAGDKVRLN